MSDVHGGKFRGRNSQKAMIAYLIYWIYKEIDLSYTVINTQENRRKRENWVSNNNEGSGKDLVSFNWYGIISLHLPYGSAWG